VANLPPHANDLPRPEALDPAAFHVIVNSGEEPIEFTKS
jgi:hypothetical protein